MSIAEKFEIIADAVYENGKQKAQQLLADSCQQNGKRTNYSLGFSGISWNDYTFEQAVDYDVAPASANQMFQYSEVKDIAGIMKRKGIKFDFITNQPTQCFAMFSDSKVEYLPKIIMPTTSSAYGLVQNCTKLISIEELVCNEKTAFQTSSGANKSFQACSQFTHCIFSGVIANDINVQWSPLLDDESVRSLAHTLKWYDSFDDGYMTKIIILHPDVWARAAQINAFDSDETFVSVVEYIDGKGWKRG